MEEPRLTLDPHRSILVVGDLGEATLGTLEDLGFVIHIANSGTEALAALAAGLRPRLVLLDMQVPERMDRVFLAALKTRQFSDVPVVILSDHDDIREDPVARLFVLETLDPAALRRTIQNALMCERTGGSRDFGQALPFGVAGAANAAEQAPTIMVVEDDADHRAAIAELLHDAGYAVSTAAHGREALSEMASAPPPSLVLLDMMMPELDGWGFMAELTQHPELSAIPVVVLSTGSRALFEAAPEAAAYLHKPIDGRELLKTVRRCLSEHRANDIGPML